MSSSPRHRQVRWARRLRHLGLAWQNALEIARAGRLSSPHGLPYEVVHQEPSYQLRRYPSGDDGGGGHLLLVPPLMITAEIYDISPDASAIQLLQQQGVSTWVVDFGSPEHSEHGMQRTLDDHVRAVANAVDRVRTLSGRAVHLAGYSQGGMFCYQAAALRKGDGIASVITFGSPVDLHRATAIPDHIARQVVSGLRFLLRWPLSRLEGLPGVISSTGFKLVSARKELEQFVEFVAKLHDRQALEKREAKRLFLRGEGFVAWPGPAFIKFVDDMVVANRLASGGFVIDGVAVSLADLRCPILYLVGDRDEIARPSAVRGIRHAAPAVTTMHEVLVPTGHFGLVVGSTASQITWPAVVDWMRWLDGAGPNPPRAKVIAHSQAQALTTEPTVPDAGRDDDGDDDESIGDDFTLAQDLMMGSSHALWDRARELRDSASDLVQNLRWQVPRLARLRKLDDDSLISPGRALAEQAEKIPDHTFFLWKGRAFTYGEAHRRVDAVVRGLIASGVRPGDRVGVMMRSRPSHLSAVTALSRLGAIAVLLSPDCSDESLPRIFDLGEFEYLVADPESAERAAHRFPGQVLALGGKGSGTPRQFSASVSDLENLDPATVVLPAWYHPDPGRARDLAMIFVGANRHDAPRLARITNRRWAFSALGAAATCTLTTSDTVYCSLPLHHPAGTLVAAGSALIGGARLALASEFSAPTFWDEVRRYGASVVYYAGEMCRTLVLAPHSPGEKNHPVRLFAGSGMRADLWKRLIERFGPVGVLEFYASTEASAVLANASGEKIGALGRPLPGTRELAIASWNFDEDDFVRDLNGHLTRARIDEPGMLVCSIAHSTSGADLAHLDPRRILRDAFRTGDIWFVTGDFVRVDQDGDHWFFDRYGDVIATAGGPVASQRIEDVLLRSDAVRMCIALGIPDGDHQRAAAAVELAGPADLALSSIAEAIATLPEHARPARLRIVARIPLTDGFRPIKRPIAELGFASGPDVYLLRERHYVPS
jgi:putative long chain acyl-CoA synthase